MRAQLGRRRGHRVARAVTAVRRSRHAVRRSRTVRRHRAVGGAVGGGTVGGSGDHGRHER